MRLTMIIPLSKVLTLLVVISYRCGGVNAWYNSNHPVVSSSERSCRRRDRLQSSRRCHFNNNNNKVQQSNYYTIRTGTATNTIPFMISNQHRTGKECDNLIGDDSTTDDDIDAVSDGTNRREFFVRYWRATTTAAAVVIAGSSSTVILQPPEVANAVGPVKILLTPIQYSAVICPPDRPIPGEKAMVGMRGLCVTVRAKLDSASPKELEKVGVYGFVNDGESGDSVLANNPDGGTDAGQFAMIESITPNDQIVTFEFIAAVPRDKDLSQFTNGIGPLDFTSLRLISYPGGQQFGAISPCEMNEFSDECEAWETINGPYTKAEFMVKSNPRTKGS